MQKLYIAQNYYVQKYIYYTIGKIQYYSIYSNNLPDANWVSTKEVQ